jgi:hypothetical protein
MLAASMDFRCVVPVIVNRGNPFSDQAQGAYGGRVCAGPGASISAAVICLIRSLLDFRRETREERVVGSHMEWDLSLPGSSIS